METYAKAYTEVLEILKYFSKEELSKIPNETIDFFEKNKDVNYDFKIDNPEKFYESGISKKAYSIFTVLASQYFLNDEQNEKLENMLKRNSIEAEKIKRELYNPDNLFSNSSKNKLNMKEPQNTSISIMEKKTFLQKIIEKIKNIFKKT